MHHHARLRTSMHIGMLLRGWAAAAGLCCLLAVARCQDPPQEMVVEVVAKQGNLLFALGAGKDLLVQQGQGAAASLVRRCFPRLLLNLTLLLRCPAVACYVRGRRHAQH